jgi:hypothetical protein
MCGAAFSVEDEIFSAGSVSDAVTKKTATPPLCV